MPKPKVYVASPFGFSEATSFFYYEKLLPILEAIGYEIIDPWNLTSQKLIQYATSSEEGRARREAWRDVNVVIGDNNDKGIQSCDILLALLDGPDADSGTCGETGYAAGLGRKIEGYRNDFRLAADNEGSVVNLQIEHFVRKGGGVISRSLEELKERMLVRYQEIVATF